MNHIYYQSRLNKPSLGISPERFEPQYWEIRTEYSREKNVPKTVFKKVCSSSFNVGFSTGHIYTQTLQISEFYGMIMATFLGNTDRI